MRMLLLLLAACAGPIEPPGNSDGDFDGFEVPDDCDDTDPLIHPDADEVCGDGIDNNCDGYIDDDGLNNTLFYRDLDGDGFGDAEGPTTTGCLPGN